MCPEGAKNENKDVKNDLKRKLFALLLSGLAIILLMGAGVDPTVLVAEAASSIRTEEPAAPVEKPVEQIETRTADDQQDLQDDVPAVELDPILLLDGQPVPRAVSRTTIGGQTYVSLKVMAQLLDSTAQVAWDAGAQSVTVTTEQLELTAVVGRLYIQANGRYLYMSEGVQMVNDQAMVSLDAVAEAFGAVTGWDAQAGTFLVTRGTGAIESGNTYYNENDLFWLSRVIYAESGNQPLEGKMAVGIVVMNRVNYPEIWPNTIKGVLAQKNQFSTYKGGRLANRTPNAESVIAAKLVLDGGVVEEVADAYWFDANRTSWASRNKTCLAVIGGHKFYG